MAKSKYKKFFGFTLLELLVSISIIGVLAGLALVSFTGSQRQARDTQRKSDIQQYSAALETDANEANGLYPVYLAATSLVTVCTNDLSLSICPEDPGTGGQYLYQSNSGGSKYVIWSNIEGLSNYWVACSNGVVGESTVAPSGGDCPIADVTPTALPTSPPATNTPTSAPASPTPTPSGPTPTPIPGGNLLINPGFESGNTGWAGIGSGGASVVTTQFHSGVQSLEIIQPASGSKSVRQTVFVTEGQNYLLSGWIKSALTATSANISVFWRNSAGSIFWTSNVGAQSGTKNWTQYSTNFTAPATAVSALFQVGVGAGAGSAWFDDLVLQ
ncbi:hypothetical protein A2112_00670 [Candidatus Woesebacteria bacterium GWA1_42_12]|uniref:CBM-cenC domain-containing protein n=1 Tax=Candidatus Woesebacteria bacterium GWA1_42_12 TaxID=1802472 RepID=A0A1F7WM65_9BACT|nr:MAG: hypothetical protein A2112_00670 [Candidatus Woesebacteria bacterium GWA1_42_12]